MNSIQGSNFLQQASITASVTAPQRVSAARDSDGDNDGSGAAPAAAAAQAPRLNTQGQAVGMRINVQA
jgi:hypothetical protein